MSTTIWIKYPKVGFHRWPDAEGQRRYLASRHRHTFWITVEVEVEHDEREVEFHDLRAMAEALWPTDGEQGSRSCEAIAREILADLGWRYTGRRIAVEVSEDGEAGARVSMTTMEGS